MKRNVFIGFLSFFIIFSVFFEWKNAFPETPDLTPGMALSFIRQTHEYSKITSQIQLHQDGFQKGYDQGFWSGGIIEPDESVVSIPPEVKLTPKGLLFFKNININPNGPSFVTLQKSQLPLTEIKNLTHLNREQPAVNVEFSWQYDTSPSTVKRFIVEGGLGTAILHHTPEGWRMETIRLDFSKRPAPISPEEKQLEEKDKNEQDTLRKKREEEKRAEKIKYWSLLRESKTPSEQIGAYQFQFTTFDQATSIMRAYDFTAQISNVDLKVDGSETTGLAKLNYRFSLWYNDIQEISQGFDPETSHHWIQIISKYGRRVEWKAEEKGIIDEVFKTLKTAHSRWTEKYGKLIGQNSP